MNARFELIIQGTNAGIWDWDVKTGNEWWSPRFYELVGYSENELPATFQNFIHKLVHPEDKHLVDNTIKEHFEKKKPFKLEIRLNTKWNGYQWFESSGQAEWDELDAPIRMAGSIMSIQERKIIQTKLENNEALLQEAGKMARLGIWEINLERKEYYWSDIMKEMHGKSNDYMPSYEDHLNNFAPEYRIAIKRTHEKVILEKCSFDIDAKRLHSNGKTFWVRNMGWPVLNQQGQIIAIRGIMQDIDNQKQDEIEINKIPILTDQNNRLINFAHIVSHNLRSHSGNISMLLETYKSMKDEQERLGIIEMLDKTSQNLTETLSYLNEVVSIQSSTNQQKEICNFHSYLNKTLEVLEGEIRLCKAVISFDFSDISEVEYIPAYMESLFLNMLTNALKYKHPERNPEIKIKSGMDSNSIWIRFQDNGSGIDLQRHGNKIFGMYKTFHRNKDSRGIGLFITKNQLESTGGEISVESQVGIGTCFCINWKCNTSE